MQLFDVGGGGGGDGAVGFDECLLANATGWRSSVFLFSHHIQNQQQLGFRYDILPFAHLRFQQ